MAKRRSPDSVVCIDLTEDDDDRDQNLEDVRKRLKGTPSAAAASKVKMEGIIEIDSDSDDGGGKIGSCAALEQQARIKKQQETHELSEVEVIPRIAPVIHPVAASIADEEIELVGTANESRLPHMRQHCPENKFVADVIHMQACFHMTEERTAAKVEGLQGNPKFCDLCFCYVCDKPASECATWGSITTGHVHTQTSHCHASDAGSDSSMWRQLRSAYKSTVQKSSAIASALRAHAGRSNALPVLARVPASTHKHPIFVPGPFAPDDQVASQDSTLTKCRKCHWYNRFEHRNFTGELHPTGLLDWCHSCGRVASEKDFGKLQAAPYTREVGDVFLGKKVIPFRIVAHDPRKMDKFKAKWATNQGSDPKWTYSTAEMEADVFHHRFGKYPSIEMILASIPVVPQDKIPETGSFHMRIMHGWDRGVNYYREGREPNRVSADETEAIMLENRNDCALLQELRNFASIGFEEPRDAPLVGDIVANWDTEARSGVSFFVGYKL